MESALVESARNVGVLNFFSIADASLQPTYGHFGSNAVSSPKVDRRKGGRNTRRTPDETLQPLTLSSWQLVKALFQVS